MKKRIYIRVRAAQQEEGRSQGAQEDACRRSADSEVVPECCRGTCRATWGRATTRTGPYFVSCVGVSPMGSTTRCLSTPWTGSTHGATTSRCTSGGR